MRFRTGFPVKILILKPSSLGDVVQALPVARLLRHQFTRAEIHWWANREFIPLLERDPDIAKVIPFDRHRWGKPSGWPMAFDIVQEMRQQHYDWVIDLQGLARSALVGWFASGTMTIGLEDHREGAPAFYDQAVPRPTRQAHAVDWYLEVLKTLRVPVHFQFEWLPVQPDAQTVVEAIWPHHGGSWVGLQPGARWLNKRWPAESFAEVAHGLLSSNPNLRIAVLGGASDRPLGELISQKVGPRCHDLTGRLTLPSMVAWLKRCSLLITNDTGPMHVAAALGTPLVALFGPTDPAHTGPYGQPEAVLRLDIPCSPCQTPTCHFQEPMACLRRLSVAQVLEAARRRLMTPRIR